MPAPSQRSAAPSDPALIRRFADALQRLGPHAGRLGLAVSGGPDSVALLLITDAAIPGQFEVATVDHGLRPAAAEECETVAEICADRAIACEVLRVSVPAGNVQSGARQERYRALGDWAVRRGLSALATAHHADDQAETLLMRLNRASGHAGLGGIRARGAAPGTAVPVIRPLLEFRRAELAQLVRAAGLDPVADPSNADQRFDRVRVRNGLAQCDWLDPAAIAASASFLAEGDAALGWAAEREWQTAVQVTAGTIEYRPAAPRAIALRVLARAIESLGQSARGQDIARLLTCLEGGQGGNLGGVLATVERGTWVLRPEPPRRSG